MGFVEQLERFTNPYERKARLYPAFLAVAPMLGIAVALYGFSLELKDSLVSLIFGLGGFYLVSNIVREFGKRIEQRLYKSWGGVPTTQIQRHRDGTIDGPTKISRHAFLAKKIGRPFPTSAEEKADPAAADEVYAAGTRWLIENTRDQTKFRMLFEENVAYGYRRNSLGLKPIAIVICLASVVWVLAAQGVLGVSGANLSAITRMSGGARVSVVFTLLLLSLWVFFFTKRTVKTAAFTYADMLLSACMALY
jgi:hypothetical protein